jgi:hypothetical protein
MRKKKTINNDVINQTPYVKPDRYDLQFESKIRKRELEKQISTRQSNLKQLAVMAANAESEGSSTILRIKEDMRKCLIQLKQQKLILSTIDIMLIEQNINDNSREFLLQIKDLLNSFSEICDESNIQKNADVSAEISNAIVKIAEDVEKNIIIEQTSGADVSQSDNTVTDLEIRNLIDTVKKEEISNDTILVDISKEKWEKINKKAKIVE